MNDADLDDALSAFFRRVVTPEPSERLRLLIAADRVEAGTARRSRDPRMRRFVAGLLAAAVGTAVELIAGRRVRRADELQPTNAGVRAESGCLHATDAPRERAPLDQHRNLGSDSDAPARLPDPPGWRPGVPYSNPFPGPARAGQLGHPV
jgi:hypothetical protein